MENASYALQIAAGTLIAIMVIALIVYVFNSMSNFQESQDLIAERESITEFNESFEVYDKSLMYGTDVLSCLNKAEDNNQKYVFDVYYGSDTSSSIKIWEARSEYFVNVSVTISSDLEETVTFSYRNSSNKVVQATSSDEFENPFLGNGTTLAKFTLPTVEFYYFTNATSADIQIKKVTSSYSDLMWDSSDASNLNSDSKLAGTKTYTTNFEAGKYALGSEGSEGAGLLVALLSTVTENEQTIYAESGNTFYSATWTTAVNDFKTRKFTCTGIEYNETTGYVESISFEEYTS